jgi:phenylacetyl-CoA:acceptor oxidoreductase subunit 2
MFGGAGSALLFMAVFAAFPAPPPLIAGLPALALVGLGLSCVWLEIGRPWRFLHVFFHPQTSWMTREGSVAVVLFALSLVGMASGISWVMWLAAIAGLVFLFCQGQMLKASKGIPAWREPAIVPLICATGLCEGTALLLLLLYLSNEVPVAFNLVCLALLAARTISWLVYRTRLVNAKAPAASLTALGNIHRVQVIVGNLIPAVLIIGSMALPEFGTPAVIGASVLMIFAGWQLKLTLITRAAQVQGYSLANLQRGRPKIRPPVRRKPDKFVF